MTEIDFWFSIGSTYTYLSVNRLADVSKKKISNLIGIRLVFERS